MHGTWCARRLEDDRLTAARNECTHQGCPLALDDGYPSFTCSCHGGEFDLDGYPIAGPPVRRLETFEVTFDGLELTIHFDR